MQGSRLRWCKHISEALNNHDHCSGLNRAIRRYGREAFVVTDIATILDGQNLFDLEIDVIAQEGTLAPNGYNLSFGGRGISKHSEESKLKIASSLAGQKLSPERLAKIRKTVLSKPNYGITHRDRRHCRGSKNYRVRIGINGRTTHIGDYDTYDEAVSARDAAIIIESARIKDISYQ